MSNTDVSLKHRSSFELYSTNEKGDPLGEAANLVVGWFLQKEERWDGSPIVADYKAHGANPLFWNYAMPEDYAGGPYEDDRWPAIACASETNDEGQIAWWVVEYDEPDANHDNRRWHSTVALERIENNGCRVSIEVTCRQPKNASEPMPDIMAAPALVRSILDLPWYVGKIGTTQLRTVPHKLSVQTFDYFASSLVDPERTVPLVLFCTGFSGSVPEHAKQLARRAIGTANVYILDWSNEELRAKEQALFARGTNAGEYACPRSSCRIYMPGINLEDHNGSLAHPSYNREALDKLRASEFANTVARSFVPEQPVPTIASMRAARASQE